MDWRRKTDFAVEEIEKRWRQQNKNDLKKNWNYGSDRGEANV